ncbi:MAG: dihydropteroate synthase [Tepidisphaeraceae bacterium]|jgi:dihydropteroate synthase
MTRLELEAWLAAPSRRPLVMGIVNITPDSFSDGGEFLTPEAAVAHAMQLVEAGADVLDIGGESTRPGSQRIEPAEQIARISPVLRKLAARTDTAMSVDTTRNEVAAAALDLGVAAVNDISAGRDDPVMFPLVAEWKAALILMHMQGEPATMQLNPVYSDVIGEIIAFLRERIEAARQAGVYGHRIVVDPGLGFGKTLGHNLEILRQLHEFTTLGQPLLVGTSRKGFIGRVTGEAEPSRRLMGTAASIAWSVAAGADIVRVHDVSEMAKVVRMIDAIRGAASPS